MLFIIIYIICIFVYNNNYIIIYVVIYNNIYNLYIILYTIYYKLQYTYVIWNNIVVRNLVSTKSHFSAKIFPPKTCQSRARNWRERSEKEKLRFRGNSVSKVEGDPEKFQKGDSRVERARACSMKYDFWISRSDGFREAVATKTTWLSPPSFPEQSFQSHSDGHFCRVLRNWPSARVSAPCPRFQGQKETLWPPLPVKVEMASNQVVISCFLG